jgi:hypothetical protein
VRPRLLDLFCGAGGAPMNRRSACRTDHERHLGTPRGTVAVSSDGTAAEWVPAFRQETRLGRFRSPGTLPSTLPPDAGTTAPLRFGNRVAPSAGICPMEGCVLWADHAGEHTSKPYWPQGLRAALRESKP